MTDPNDHNPVPFDFVPFSDIAPQTRTIDEWESLGTLLSGSIDFVLTPLTPVHIVGKQDREGGKENYRIKFSHFNRAGHMPVLPGTSLKGSIRAFFEAVANCWVSAATDQFPFQPKERHWGFSAFGFKDEKKGVHFGPVIPHRFHPIIKDDRIDLASFLFGNVIEPDGIHEKAGHAFPSRLIFEDISFDNSLLESNTVKLPDVPGTAFMGGPKPNISNWWYFEPYGIAERKTGRHSVTEFIGGEYRGRKFYFHQKPDRIVPWYDEEKNWSHKTKKKGRLVNNYYIYPVDVLPNNITIPGKIYFNRVPVSVLNLFLSVLQPDKPLQHKIGYGQPFGLGSIDLKIAKVTVSESEQIVPIFEDYNFSSVIDDGLKVHKQFVDNKALPWILRILSFDGLLDNEDYILSYPPYKKGFFQTPVPIYEVRKIQKQNPGFTTDMIAEKLFPIKRTIDFRVYQEKSYLWHQIKNRIK